MREKSANIAIFVPHAGCPHRCAFCNQHSISGGMGIPDNREVERILVEAERNLGERMQRSGKRMEAQIAFFGGSFTAIPREEMERLLRVVQPFLERAVFSGIRVSTRPDAVDQETLRILRDYGVTAVELGAQSMDDKVLATAGRGHTAGHVVRASGLIRSDGFELGLQMMTGLPGDSDAGACATASALAALRPDTVRIYPALVLEHTSLADWWRAGDYRPQPLEEAVRLCARLLRFFEGENIRVIKLGLHSGGDLERELLVGPYHPAFRELCEGKVLLEQALEQLEEEKIQPGPVRLTVGQGAASKMAGQRRENLHALRARGYLPKIREEESVPYLRVRAERGK